MTDREVALEQLRVAHERVLSIDRDRGEAMRLRDDALRAARTAGAGYDAIQQVTGLSNATITKAVRRQ